jgi:hypothetical protein
MKGNINTIKFQTGKLYFLEELALTKSFNFSKELKLVEKEYDPDYTLTTCTIMPLEKYKNEKLIFEVLPTRENHAFSFLGFLYPDGTINGRMKWSRDAKFPDDHFTGIYKKIANKLVIFGHWSDHKISDPVCLVIKKN